jgi:hypothetical protein
MLLVNVSLPSDPPIRLLDAFQKHFPDESPTCILQAPGRELWIAAAQGESHCYMLAVPDLRVQRAIFTYQSAKHQRTIIGRPLPAWARSPAKVILALENDGFEIDHLVAVIAGEEARGPRYEYAVDMAVAALCHELKGRPYTQESIIHLVDQVRRDTLKHG